MTNKETIELLHKINKDIQALNLAIKALENQVLTKHNQDSNQGEESDNLCDDCKNFRYLCLKPTRSYWVQNYKVFQTRVGKKRQRMKIVIDIDSKVYNFIKNSVHIFQP